MVSFLQRYHIVNVQPISGFTSTVIEYYIFISIVHRRDFPFFFSKFTSLITLFVIFYFISLTTNNLWKSLKYI